MHSPLPLLKNLLRVTAISIAVGASFPAAAERIFHEALVGKVTAGYDAKSNKTIIKAFYAVAAGPDSLEVEAERFAKACAQDSIKAAAAAAYSAPGEVGVKVIVAVKAFNYHFPRCLSVNEFARQYIDRFKLRIEERAETSDGIRLVAQTGNDPLADGKVKAYEWMYRQTGAPVFRGLVNVEKAMTNLRRVDIDVQAPREIGQALQGLSRPGGHPNSPTCGRVKLPHPEHT